ncbi:MAG: HAD family phosphatase [Lachnospiraceae bacterium]|nr:HAD family phosphatase [Lachnospiraceae bacterium]
MWTEVFGKCDAVLFDLDGTVVDSMWIWKQIDIDYFCKYDLELPKDYQKEIEGLSFYETAVLTHDRYIPQISVDTIMMEWNDMAYEHYAHIIKPKEYVIDFLKYLRSSGHKVGMVTSNSKPLCSATLKNNGMIGFFDTVITGEDSIAGKPAPDVYLKCAALLGVDNSRCVVFEDLCNGIIAGNRAGMTTVAVNDEYSGHQWEEKCSMADYSILSYKEIVDEVCKPNS